MMKKKILVGALVVTLTGAGLFAAKQSFAATTGGQSRMATLVQEIATKFGLKPADVQAVFDQNRTEMQAKMLTNQQSKLDQDVKAGKITADQEKLIIAKDAELAENRQANQAKMKALTPAERKAAFAAEKTDLDAWAKVNAIDPKYLHPGRGGMGEMRGAKWDKDDSGLKPNPSASPAAVLVQ